MIQRTRYGVNHSEVWSRYPVYDCETHAAIWAELMEGEEHQCWLIQYSTDFDYSFWLN